MNIISTLICFTVAVLALCPMFILVTTILVKLMQNDTLALESKNSINETIKILNGYSWLFVL